MSSRNVRYDFLVIGSINFDILIKQERLPKVGETLQASEAVTCPGGKGANQATQIARLNGKVGFFGAVGSDIFGPPLEESLRMNGVDTSLLLTKSGSSGLGVVNYIDGGQVVSTIVKGANYKVTAQDVDKIKYRISESNFVILQNEIPENINTQVIDIASRGGTKVILNAAPVRPIDDFILKKVSYLVLNEVEASYYLGEDIGTLDKAINAARDFAATHNLSLIITLGPMGSIAVEGSEAFIIPPINVQVAETTGAGDSYIGALTYRLNQGVSLGDACRFAGCAASITVQSEGAARSMPDLDTLMNLYHNIYTTV